MNNDKNRAAGAKPNDSDPANRDPITGAPGAHPVGTGVGAAAGGAAGAAIGALGGPVGAVAGAAIGAVAGGLGGKAAAEAVDPTVEEEYWRENYTSRPYADDSLDFTRDYAPAYRYGWESVSTYEGKSFDDVEPTLRRNWDRSRSGSSLTWEKAKDATKDAWERVTGRRHTNG
jgi:hypothetical protein